MSGVQGSVLLAPRLIPGERPDPGTDAGWVRQGTYSWDGPGGTRISAALVGSGPDAGWRYTAWGAEEMPGASYWEWHQQAADQVVYERDQGLRQRRPWLGVYRTASEARQACLGWLAGAEAAMAAGESGG
jgi:hypothetical protein